MLETIQDLIYHKGYANAALVKAIRGNEAAAEDAELRKTLHHILLANRYWLLLILGLPFTVEEESRVPETIEDLVVLYRETHAQEKEWMSQIKESDLARALVTPYIPGHSYSVAQALLQICMHSHGHRAQCAIRLRQLGGVPPNMDFILWLNERPVSDWS